MRSKLIFGSVLCLMMVLFTNCSIKYPTTKQSGKEDIAYLIFVSEGNKKYEVDVVIDETTAFSAKTVKAKKSDLKGKIYSANTGKRKITVSKKGQKISEKYIFLSPQETKTILLQ